MANESDLIHGTWYMKYRVWKRMEINMQVKVETVSAQFTHKNTLRLKTTESYSCAGFWAHFCYSFKRNENYDEGETNRNLNDFLFCWLLEMPIAN